MDNLPFIMDFPTGEEVVYIFSIALYFAKLENPGWFERFVKGKNKGKRKAATRYKVIDYDNRIKFLQDAVVAAIGIPNDCQIFEGRQIKMEDPDNPRAEVFIELSDPETYLNPSESPFLKGG